MQKFTLFILVLFIIYHSVAHASNFQFIGNVVEYSKNPRGIRLRCENASVDVRVLADDLFRIRMHQGEEIPDAHSFAVVRQPDDASPAAIDDKGDFIVLSTRELVLRIQKAPCRLTFTDTSGNLICEDHESFGMGWKGSKVFCWKTLHDESFYGLGEKTRNLNKRGDVYTMWNSDIPAYTPVTDPLYQSHPFFLGLHQGRGFGIFLDNSYRTHFNLGAGTNQFYSFGADDGMLDYYFFYGPELKKVIRCYSDLVGRMPLPPKWSLGYQQCRWSYYPDAEVMELAGKFRQKQIPCDAIYLDIHHMDGYRCFTWHPERFQDPDRMLADLGKMGFKVVVIIDPGIKVDSSYDVYQQGLEGDHFCTYPDGSHYQGQVWPGWCHFPDFSKPQTRKWWGELYGTMVKRGVRGFWNDMNEPATWGGTFPDIVQFDDEGRRADHLKMHNLYGALMAKATYAGLTGLRANERPFILTRAGFSGVQRYAAVWTGDNVASWEHLRLSLKMCLGLGMSGVAFCGADIGGFAGAPSPELYTRWLQLGIFYPLCRTHTSINTPDQEPWSYGDENEAINKTSIQLRYQLMPYLYQAFQQAATTGLPIMRPMVLEFQDDARTIGMDDQFMFGKDLLVAPICHENQDARNVYLPKGDWYDFWSGERISGPVDKKVTAPLNSIPIFVRAGALIPMQNPMNYVDEKPADPLILSVFPGEGNFRGSWYEDDGISFDFQKDGYCTTPFQVDARDDQLTVTFQKRTGRYTPPSRSFFLHIRDVKNRPRSVTVNGIALSPASDSEQLENMKSGWTYDSVLYVKLPDQGVEMTVLVR